MVTGPYALALAAGLVSALNPCGFALLPAYLGLVVTDGGRDAGGRQALGRALRMTVAMTTGFVGVFALFGVLVVPLALSLERWLPWVTVVIGALLVLAGGWLAAGRELRLRLPGRAGAAPTGSTASMVGYGVAYALASLSCTAGPFLAVLATTTRSGGLGAGLLVVASYAAGMALVVGVLATAVALAREGVVARARRLLPLVHRASGVLLVLAGAYVGYYGWYELRVRAGDLGPDPVVDAAREVQGRLALLVADTGARTLMVVLLVLAAAAALLGRRRRRDLRDPTTRGT